MLQFPIEHPDIKRVLEGLKPILHGKDEALVKILVGILSGGHLLLEDLPGLGKTTMAIGVAKVLGLSFGRIQCTNDLLPTDVTGLNIFRVDRGEFEFRAGPIFNNLLLVDEINRATPKTQSALLEAMGEEQVTIDGVTYRLPRPFLVIATQNPIEHFGTFPLPESQMDRFMMRVSFGYPEMDAEMEILRFGKQRSDLEAMEPTFSPEWVVKSQEEIDSSIHASDHILKYILLLAEKSRYHPMLAAGISTRGAMILLQCAKTVAWMQGRSYVIPEDVKAYADDALVHRLQLRTASREGAADILHSIIQETPAI